MSDMKNIYDVLEEINFEQRVEANVYHNFAHNIPLKTLQEFHKQFIFNLIQDFYTKVLEPETPAENVQKDTESRPENVLKCPIHNIPLEYELGYDGDYSCEKCGRNKMFGSEELWQELIRTRKALEIIKKEMSKETMPDFAVISDALKGVSDE